jgi:hypothetical protein
MDKRRNSPMSHPVTVDALRKFAETFVEQEAGRLGTDGWWQTPLLATAPIDSRFDQLPRIVAADHLHPRDLLSTAKSIIVFYIPFKNELVKENRKGDRLLENRRDLDYFSDLADSTHVCGKCAALIPCSFKNPVAVLETSGKRKIN